MFTYSDLKEAPLVFWSMMARTRQRNVFLEVFFIFPLFKVNMSHKKARFGLSFPVVNIIKMISVIKLRLHQGTRSPMITWLCLWLYSICFSEISQNLHNFFKFSSRSFKSRKKVAVTEVVSLIFAISCFFPLSQICSQGNRD